MDPITKEIRKLLLAGLGAAAEGKERGEQLVERLAEKGEATLESGKVLNEELKRNIKKTLRRDKGPQDVMEAVKGMDAEQLAALKEKIAQLEEEKAAEKQEEAAEEQEEEPAEEEEAQEDGSD